MQIQINPNLINIIFPPTYRPKCYTLSLHWIMHYSHHFLSKTHRNTLILIKMLKSHIDGFIPEMLITVNTNIKRMVALFSIPSTVTAIPYVRFFTSALGIVKQCWTSSSAIVRSRPDRTRSSKTQLTTDNASTLGVIPPPITTDGTPAEGRMKYFDSSGIVVCWIYQSDLYVRVS